MLTTAVLAVVALLVLCAGFLSSLYINWLWFGEVGFRDVFWTRIWWRVLVGVVVFVFFFLVVVVNTEFARRLAPGFRIKGSGDVLEPRGEVVRRFVAGGGVLLSALAALVAGILASTQWETFLLAAKRVSFGVADPIFGHDVSFYVFSLPMWRVVHNYVLAALVVGFVLAAVVHIAMGGIETRAIFPGGEEGEAAGRPQMPQFSVELGDSAVAHLSGALAAIFVLLAVGQLFRGWGLLYSKAGAVYGAGYTDVHLRLPATYLLMAVALVLAVALVWNIRRRRGWWPFSVVVWIGVVAIAQVAVPAAYQSLFVNPNQLTKERDYIGHNLTATKAAYGLDGIVQQPLGAKIPLTAEKLKGNEPTLRNIRLWDPETLTTSYRQLQELRTYYSFHGADVDRYTVNGVYRQTMLSPRELDISGLPPQAQTWVNQHITYTHGFGVAMSAVNQVTNDGSPDFLVQDIPSRSAPGLEITQPRIYYGEYDTNYSLVKTKNKEFDYPGATGDVYRSYDGTGGIPISSPINRLAFGINLRTIKFFTVSSITKESRLIIRNDIATRIGEAAPFLTLDHDPYMVIADGRLWWIQDAYTTTDRYPYSTPQGKLNYLRNSVKIVVDAYNGTMKFYVFDEKDPLLKAYRSAYPSLFTPKEQMPRSLLGHLRYPEDLFNTQAEVYATYHVDDPDVLYNKGDQWAIPENVALSGSGRMQAYYVVMRIPGTTKEEFLLMLPFVPNGRSNMISWLGARSDPGSYGKLTSFVFSKSTTVFGPSQVEAAINQDPEIASQRTLWGQQGSQVLMGNLLVTPIEDSLLYVQPLYLQSTQTKLPQLKRVIVFYRAPSAGKTEQNARQVVAMRPTLGEALAAAFGEGVASDGTPAATPSSASGGSDGASLDASTRALIARANKQFDAAQAALRAGDFAAYGKRIGELQRTLRSLEGR